MTKEKIHYLIEMKSPSAEGFSIFKICGSKEESLRDMQAALQRDTDKFNDYTFRVVREEIMRKTIISPFKYHDQVAS
jgi:hypothetical protein